MSTTLDEQINQLKQAIAELEAQRAILGDEAVEAALIPSRKKLADLQALVESQREEPIVVPQRKRKLVTLLYMDVVGSTAMTQDLDPEDTMEIMENAILRLAAPIEAYGGHVTRYTGDGFKAIFGDPIAREDDPEKAIRAGLEILEVSAGLEKEIEQDWGIEDFQVRIGVDTGLAAFGGQTEGKETVKGRVVNLAVRIESAAPPGCMLISHNTYRHVRGVFNVEPQEPIMAKGFPEPVPVYLVKEIKPRAFRVQTRGVEGIDTRMVGRNDELRFLQDALMTAFEEGEGHVMTVSGEAGVGKSRLLYEFDNWFELLPGSQAVRFFQGRGRQEAQNSPYSLLRDVFTFRFQILDDDTGEEARTKIKNGFGEIFGTERDGIMRAQILGQLLGFDFSDSRHLKGVLNDAEQLRNRGLMYLIQYFKDLSQEVPVVIFLEDIHWADDSSLDVVSRIGESTRQHPILLICAARPILFERRPYWGEGQTYHTRIELRPLSKRESRQLVDEILKLTDDIPSELRELVVQGAEGNPFYTEELIKMLIEDGVVISDQEIWQIDLTRLEEVNVPPTLAGVLQARLDSLPIHERTVLQQASVVGRLFWDRIVIYIQSEGGNGGDPQLIPQTLNSLRNRELVYRHEESAFVGAVEYLFKHDVLREVTYESVIKRLRNTYHGLVADWLIKNSKDRIGEYFGLIAEHLLLAGRSDQACEYFLQAGESALASYANPEAEGYFKKALAIVPRDSIRAELTFAYAKSIHMQGRSRYDESQQYYRQAIDLYEKLGNQEHIAEIYYHLSYLLWDIDHLEAWNICQEALQKLKGAPDSVSYARLLGEASRTAFFRDIKDQVITLCYQAQEMADKFGDLEASLDAGITLALQNHVPEESIRSLHEIITLAEAEGLLRTSSRAHLGLAANLGSYYVDFEAAFYHYYRAAELAKQIGDVQRILFAFVESFNYYLRLGKLKEAEQLVSDFFRDSNVSQEDVKSVMKIANRSLLDARGEWAKYIGLYRPVVDDTRLGGSFQAISWGNYFLVSSLLEMNRYESLYDLTEVEERLKENIKIGWDNIQYRSYSMLVITFARQRQFGTAHEYLLQAEEHSGKFEHNGVIEARASAEFELAFAEKRWNDAVKFSEITIDIMKISKYHWGLARKLIDLGDALIGRNEPGDLERARETYQQSLDMFTEMGAPGYIRVIEERRGDLHE